MFKEGDRVKYVVVGKFDNMTLGNIYVVKHTYYDHGIDYITLIDDTKYNIINMYAHRFELDIRNIRKQKLEKINQICSK